METATTKHDMVFFLHSIYMKIPAIAGSRIFIFCCGQLQLIIIAHGSYSIFNILTVLSSLSFYLHQVEQDLKETQDLYYDFNHFNSVLKTIIEK